MLIKCPHCGEKISDTAETCIHCGKPIAEKSPPANDRAENYATLSPERQKQLISEFHTLLPNQKAADGKNKRLNAVLIVIYVTMAAGLIPPLFIIFLDDAPIALTIFCIICLSISVMLSIYYRIAITSANKAYAIYLRTFVYWLVKCKNIRFNATFTGKFAQTYDAAQVNDGDKNKIDENILQSTDTKE